MTSRKIQHTLDNWRGAGAELWSYSTSHSRLVLRLRNPKKEVLYIIMEDVYAIFGIVSWPNSDLVAMYNDARREWLVRDIRSGFVAPCGLVRLSDVDPSR